ncbi:type II secretion system protein GspM [Pseudomonas oligotrophica]|uniref:type II secretion system protein GspM n=1 Tax=Pseudomonas oligotrophica TaxID=2912055 RepID=UPI001F02C4B2|nr:type II secretion system protein GspM [Pseudomonas oligotrophica]MCF7203131.1 type II secretion system protein GspM [Pseudomonas oligotrophica]
MATSSFAALKQRWRALAPREQWLTYAVGLTLLGLLYLLLVVDPLTQRRDALDAGRRQAEASQLEAQASLRELEAKLAADPNRPYREALDKAQLEHEALSQRIDAQTRALVSPAKMKLLLQDLLRNQPKLRLVELESFSAPLRQPTGGAEPGSESEPAPAASFYRHGLRLRLEGGYFDLLTYLQAVQASGWRLHWDSLDYQVEEAGPAQARILIELHTLSRHAGWVGV